MSASATDRCSPASLSGCANSAAGTSGETAGVPPQKPSRLWLWFVAAFVVQAAMWTALFIVASHHRVEEVPLATSGRR